MKHHISNYSYGFWNEERQRTGRTKQMVEAAVNAFKNGQNVGIVVHSEQYKKNIIKLLKERGIELPSPESITEITTTITYYLIDGIQIKQEPENQSTRTYFPVNTIKIFTANEWDTTTNTVKGYNCKLFIDHYVAEQAIEKMFENYSKQFN